MTIDYPNNHANGQVPMLDVSMWIEEIAGRRYIVYEHFEKEMASKAVIHASSAIPFKMKRTVLTQEMLRILLHCSNMIPWERVLGHLNNFTRKMQYSGYDQAFRYAVANSAINAYEVIRDRETQGIRQKRRRRRKRRGTSKEALTPYYLSQQHRMVR